VGVGDLVPPGAAVTGWVSAFVARQRTSELLGRTAARIRLAAAVQYGREVP